MLIDPEYQKLYSPSQWSNRLKPDEIVDSHLNVMAKHSQIARDELLSFRLELNENKLESNNGNGEHFIEFFFKTNDSLTIIEKENQEINFNSRNVFVYLHGGYWQWGSFLHSSFMAKNFVANDIIVASVGYNLCPNVSMDRVVLDCERAVAKILQFAAHSSSNVYVCGHSAGAHLAAMMLFVDFDAKYGLFDCNQHLKGLILVSGCFNLVPLLRTDVNDNLRMNIEMAKQMSPMLFYDDCSISKLKKQLKKVLLCYGQHESPAFIEQSKEFARLLREKHGVGCVELMSADADHFDVIENLRFDDFILTKVNQMKINYF